MHRTSTQTGSMEPEAVRRQTQHSTSSWISVHQRERHNTHRKAGTPDLFCFNDESTGIFNGTVINILTSKYKVSLDKLRVFETS